MCPKSEVSNSLEEGDFPETTIQRAISGLQTLRKQLPLAKPTCGFLRLKDVSVSCRPEIQPLRLSLPRGCQHGALVWMGSIGTLAGQAS